QPIVFHTSVPSSLHTRPPPSFPTRRSSDLGSQGRRRPPRRRRGPHPRGSVEGRRHRRGAPGRKDRHRRSRHRGFVRDRRVHAHRDRKSTRLNSSHVSISYAVFCLKKKKQLK